MSRDDEHLLDFEAAMRDFAIMFPTASPERIEQVLRQHDGDVASTIDTLLRETQPSLPPPTYEEATSSPTHRSPTHPQPQPSVSQRRTVTTPLSAPPNYSRTFFHTEPNTSQAAPVRRRDSRTSSDTFTARQLQYLKRENERRLDSVTDEKEARILEDEQMALLLQQREIVRSARSSSVAAVPRRRSSSKHSGPRVPEGPVVDEVIINADGQDLREKIRKLSKASKQRLMHLATRFRSGSSENVC